MALFVNPIYDYPIGYQGPALALATIAFAIQIYCDFSGYSDIAFGSAQVMGLRLMKNFQHPYFAKSMSEFWRRWHISLSTWFRDYVYIPLGGNRAGILRMVVNLLITFLISGLWHGANWTFVIWGALHGMYVVSSGLMEPVWNRLRNAAFAKQFSPVLDGVSWLTTFGLVCFAWIFFRAWSVNDALYIVTHLFSGWGTALSQAASLIFEGAHAGLGGLVNGFLAALSSLLPVTRAEIALSAMALLFLLYMEVKQYQENFLEQFNIKVKQPAFRYLCYLLLVIAILTFGTSYTGVEQAFIYFQF
jgi:hypothetical protein